MVYYSIVFYIKQNKEKNKPEMLRNETTRRMSYRPSANTNTLLLHEPKKMSMRALLIVALCGS